MQNNSNHSKSVQERSNVTWIYLSIWPRRAEATEAFVQGGEVGHGFYCPDKGRLNIF
jgi:hypothetical protein